MKIEVPLVAPRPYSPQQNSEGNFLDEKQGFLLKQDAGGPRGSVSHTYNENRGTFEQSLGGKRGSMPNITKNSAISSRPNGYRGSVGNIRHSRNQEKNIKSASQNDGLKIIQHSVGGVSKIILGQNGESDPSSPNAKELSNIFKDQGEACVVPFSLTYLTGLVMNT